METTEKEVVVSLRNVTKYLSGRKIINDVSFDIYRGETFVIMGCSGSGKSTLLRLLNGSLRPEKGHVLLKGKDITHMNTDELDAIRKQIGMVFQYSALLDSLTIEDNIALPIREHTKTAENIISIIVRMKLALVGLRGIEKYYPSEISGGMRKRVGLARAIALDPQIVFYDEPTSGLDPVFSAAINNLIMELNEKLMITSIVVTHDMQSVFSIANRAAMLHEGALVSIGTPQEIKTSDNPYIKQFINGLVQGPIDFSREDMDLLQGFDL